ncbi:hypothetical protein ACJPEZ_002188 [Campylobacter coli]|nr:hypothetical protein [Campylobacter coli]EHQ5319749.1 hypothetical protein [Campylobacter coli]EHY1159534.1 hypothetical protein [Campylobacter coli]EIE0715050.1 hypothetical protein [Campylobacter coli]EII0213269.1 hypothetical protein [Campylobacter coli]
MIDMLMCFIKSAKLTPKNAAKANPESDTIGATIPPPILCEIFQTAV